MFPFYLCYYLSDITRAFHVNGKISEYVIMVMMMMMMMMMITVTVCYKVRMIILGDSVLITANYFKF